MLIKKHCRWFLLACNCSRPTAPIWHAYNAGNGHVALTNYLRLNLKLGGLGLLPYNLALNPIRSFKVGCLGLAAVSRWGGIVN